MPARIDTEELESLRPGRPQDDLADDSVDLLAEFSDIERRDIERERKRARVSAEVAKWRWLIARKIHRLENGQKPDFETYRFQKEIYTDTATELVIYGAVQWG